MKVPLFGEATVFFKDKKSSVTQERHLHVSG